VDQPVFWAIFREVLWLQEWSNRKILIKPIIANNFYYCKMLIPPLRKKLLLMASKEWLYPSGGISLSGVPRPR